MTTRDTEIDDIQASMDIQPAPRIMSLDEICNLLRHQANMRAPENDAAGVLQGLADQLNAYIEEES